MARLPAAVQWHRMSLQRLRQQPLLCEQHPQAASCIMQPACEASTCKLSSVQSRCMRELWQSCSTDSSSVRLMSPTTSLHASHSACMRICCAACRLYHLAPAVPLHLPLRDQLAKRHGCTFIRILQGRRAQSRVAGCSNLQPVGSPPAVPPGGSPPGHRLQQNHCICCAHSSPKGTAVYQADVLQADLCTLAGSSRTAMCP